jgi:hypothetical protein
MASVLDDFVLDASVWVLLILGTTVMFPELKALGSRLLSSAARVLSWPSNGYDGFSMGGGRDSRQLFVVFDPPFWKIHRWAWMLREISRGTPTGKVRVLGRELRAFEKRRPPEPRIDSRRRVG